MNGCYVHSLLADFFHIGSNCRSCFTDTFVPDTPHWTILNIYIPGGITSVKDLEDYFHGLSKNGWVVEYRMGAGYIIGTVNTGDEFNIIVNKYTRYYYRLKYISKNI